MFKSKTVLLQMQSLISGYDFKKLVFEHDGDKSVKSFTTRNLLNVMLYVHMTSKQSLRDIVDSLVSKKNLWYHLGLKSLSRNNLSHALKIRSSVIFEKTFYELLHRLRKERGLKSDKRFRFKMSVKTFDSTTISLCLSLFEWATFRSKKGGIKLHTMFNNREQIPEFVNITEAGRHDVRAADKFPIASNSIYVFDKGYICFKFLEKISKNKAFFVTRTKTNTRYKIISRQQKNQSCIKADWIVEFSSYKSKDYPEALRVIRYYDEVTSKTYEFMTNNFNLTAKTIADIYKSRWDIELFFKWIKQNLKVKTFIGTSENAVKIQIWTAMIAYLLTEYIRFKSKTSFTILKTFRILSENILCNADIYNLLGDFKPPSRIKTENCDLQLLMNF
ncbi:MAG TPA: IS4 family transposase [Spirochaetota bacterium]|nr:IS4 family transposase [Spirochaetota bacterium]